MCNLWGMLLPSRTWTTRSPPTFKNMYVCDICIRTYHWQCLLRTNCYNANERRAVDTYDTWACPACVNLSENEKKERTFRSLKRELVKVSYNLTWEAEELQNTCESFWHSLQMYKEHITALNLPQLAPGIHLNDLQEQGLSVNQERNSFQPFEIKLWN